MNDGDHDARRSIRLAALGSLGAANVLVGTAAALGVRSALTVPLRVGIIASVAALVIDLLAVVLIPDDSVWRSRTVRAELALAVTAALLVLWASIGPVL